MTPSLSDEVASECVTRAEFEKLVRRVAKLERANKPAPKKNPSVGIYYRDGKPMKGKPKEQG
jgi:hypothetical protein